MFYEQCLFEFIPKICLVKTFHNIDQLNDGKTQTFCWFNLNNSKTLIQVVFDINFRFVEQLVLRQLQNLLANIVFDPTLFSYKNQFDIFAQELGQFLLQCSYAQSQNVAFFLCSLVLDLARWVKRTFFSYPNMESLALLPLRPFDGTIWSLIPHETS